MPGNSITVNDDGIAIERTDDDGNTTNKLQFHDAQEVHFRMVDIGQAAKALEVEWTDDNGNTESVRMHPTGGSSVGV